MEKVYHTQKMLKKYFRKKTIGISSKGKKAKKDKTAAELVERISK